MSDSKRTVDNTAFFIKVIIWSVIFLLAGGGIFIATVDMHNDGPDRQEIAAHQNETQNAFWKSVIDNQDYSDTPAGRLGRDVAPLLHDTEKITAEFGTESRIFPDRLEDVRLPSTGEYSQAEKDLGGSVFTRADDDSYSYRFSAEFLGKLRLSQTAQAQTLIVPIEYPKPGTQWDYYSYYGLALTYIIATVLAFFVSGAYDESSYQLCGWNYSEFALTSRFFAALLSPVVFTVWLLFTILAWPKRVYRRRKQNMLDWEAQQELLEGHPYKDELLELYKRRTKLEKYASQGSTVATENLATLNEYIRTVEGQMPQEVKSWRADDASRDVIPEIEDIQMQIATKHASKREMLQAKN